MKTKIRNTLCGLLSGLLWPTAVGAHAVAVQAPTPGNSSWLTRLNNEAVNGGENGGFR